MRTTASKKIQGITVEIGGDTTALSKALNDINKDISGTKKELREVERLLKLDPHNTELLAQKQELLGKEVEATKTKLDALRQAQEKVQEQIGKNDEAREQYDELTRAIISTEHALEELEQAAQEAENAASDIGVALSKISEGAGSISKASDNISKAFAPATKAVAALATAAVATVPATEELRNELSRLDLNAQESGADAEDAREAWEAFAIQSGDTASAVEGVSNLLQAGFTESNLQKAVEGLAGAAQRFPDTLKIESLSDSLQETLASGTATGQFGELLDRLGIGAENFSEQLASCSTEAEKQNLVLQTLADAGLNETYQQWMNNNEAMVENKQANLDLQQSMAEVAEKLLPLVTMVTEKAAELIEWFNGLSDGAQTTIVVILALAAAISPVAGAISKVTGAISAVTGNLDKLVPMITKVKEATTGAISFLISNPIALIIAAIIALVALIATKGDEIQAILQKIDDFLQGVFAKDWTEVFGPILGGALNAFFANIKNIWDSIKKVLDGIIDFIRGVFSGDWERAWNGVKEMFSGVIGNLSIIFKRPLNAIIEMINVALSAINLLIKGVNKIPGVNIPEIGKIAYLAKGDILYGGSAVVGKNGPEYLTVDQGHAIVQPLNSRPSNTYNNTLGGVNITIYGAPGQDVDELADEVADRMEIIVRQKGAVFA